MVPEHLQSAAYRLTVRASVAITAAFRGECALNKRAARDDGEGTAETVTAAHDKFVRLIVYQLQNLQVQLRQSER